MKRIAAYVDGSWLDTGAADLVVIDPATDSRGVASAPKLGPGEVSRALASAAAGGARWRSVSPTRRADVLAKAGYLIAQRADELTADLVAESGKPIREASAEIAKTAATFRYYAGQVGALDGRSFRGATEGVRHETWLEPVGVAALITPWNVPGASPARKLAPALLAGNAVVLKPSSFTPITAWHIVRSLLDAGLEPEAVQLLLGDGAVVGQALANDTRIDALSFTGSTEVGLELRAGLGWRLTRLQLELGGKNAALVLPDAHIAHAASRIAAAAFGSAGQQCTATSRVIVHAEVADALVAALRAEIEQIVVGPPADPTTTMGPLISSAARASVQGFVDRALNEGAVLECGGGPIGDGGNFFAPTLLTRVRPQMEIATAEVFGPVLAVLSVSSLDEAIETLNLTPFGLSCAVHTADLVSASRVADEADTGIVAVNGSTAGIELTVPFGGFKASGTESKEHGGEALHFYTRIKSVSWEVPS